MATEFDTVEIGSKGAPIWNELHTSIEARTNAMKEGLKRLVDFDNPQPAKDMLEEMKQPSYDIEKLELLK